MSGATRPRIAITLGDPRGIGPEIVGRALADDRIRAACDPVVIGPEGAGIPVDRSVGSWSPSGGAAAAGRLAGTAIEDAAALALSKSVDGIVTAPIDKAALLAGGYDFPGHTEMLARIAGVPVAMMLASDRLRVVLVTTHIALRDVVERLTRDAIVETAEITRRGLRDWYGIADPRLALCALNPHAGDGGRFGNEDDELLSPAA
ncbi:MAG TPA: 4-hydroxythreonine-4-phosphate dehydrogenase PdxA, partial [Gemmatimonadaceae bacterium]